MDNDIVQGEEEQHLQEEAGGMSLVFLNISNTYSNIQNVILHWFPVYN